jgi:hypothetical protein
MTGPGIIPDTTLAVLRDAVMAHSTLVWEDGWYLCGGDDCLVRLAPQEYMGPYLYSAEVEDQRAAHQLAMMRVMVDVTPVGT